MKQKMAVLKPDVHIACRQDSSETPTATPMFLGSGITTILTMITARCNRKSEIKVISTSGLASDYCISDISKHDVW